MNPIVKQNGINYGIAMGIISILITAVIYAVDLKLFVNMWLGFAIIATFIVIGVVLVSKTKKQLDGLITFKDAFTVYFIAAVIGATMSVAFNIVLFNFVDLEAKDTLNEIALETTVNMMKKFGAPTEQIAKQAAAMQGNDNYSIGNLSKGLVFNFIFSAVFGSILALIFRNKSSNNLE
ncbi:DUF4199 domain-containing protein [Flavobacterium pedocola]